MGGYFEGVVRLVLLGSQGPVNPEGLVSLVRPVKYEQPREPENQ